MEVMRRRFSLPDIGCVSDQAEELLDPAEAGWRRQKMRMRPQLFVGLLCEL